MKIQFHKVVQMSTTRRRNYKSKPFTFYVSCAQLLSLVISLLLCCRRSDHRDPLMKGSGTACSYLAWVFSKFLLVLAPSQDQHHIDSFHRHYVRQSKRKSLLEYFLVARQWYVSRTPNELLVTQRDIQLGYELNEACCRKLLQHLKNKYYIL